jgi:hypothetical protein
LILLKEQVMVDTIGYNEYVDYSPDDRIWIPFTEDEIPTFKTLISEVRKAFIEGTKKEKGDTLESLMTFVYKKFKHIRVYHNEQRGDNQIDHIIEFIDGVTPTFIHQNIGLTLIGESKNHQKSIGVREVADLNELLRSKESKLGIFSSYYSFSKGASLWSFAEGKRRKLALTYYLLDKRKIIGFTIDEIESLLEKNFYTLLKQKYSNLVNELKDDFIDYKNPTLPYQDQLYQHLMQLHENGIIDEESFIKGIDNIESKYGPLESES